MLVEQIQKSRQLHDGQEDKSFSYMVVVTGSRATETLQTDLFKIGWVFCASARSSRSDLVELGQLVVNHSK